MVSKYSAGTSVISKRKRLDNEDCIEVPAKKRRPPKDVASGSNISGYTEELDTDADSELDSDTLSRYRSVKYSNVIELDSDGNCIEDGDADESDASSSGDSSEDDWLSDDTDGDWDGRDELMQDLDSALKRPFLRETRTADEKELRRVLARWSNNGYSGRHKWAVHLFQREYSWDIREGVSRLSGNDALLVQQIQEVVEEAGYLILLGELEYKEVGEAEPEDFHRWKKRNSRRCGLCRGLREEPQDSRSDSSDGPIWEDGDRSCLCYQCDEGGFFAEPSWSDEDFCPPSDGDFTDYDDESCPEMDAVVDSDTYLKDVVDLGGCLMSQKQFSVDGDLIQGRILSKQYPDTEECSDYGEVTHYYHHSALVLVHRSDAMSFLDRGMGVYYPLKKLEKSLQDRNFEQARTWASKLVGQTKYDRRLASKLLRYAIRLQDQRIWVKVVCEAPLDSATDEEARIINGWKALGLGAVCLLMEGRLQSAACLTEKQVIFQLVRRLQVEIGSYKAEVDSWCQSQLREAVHAACASSLPKEDIPVVLDYTQNVGALDLWEIPIMQMSLEHFMEFDDFLRGWDTSQVKTVMTILEKKLDSLRPLKRQEVFILRVKKVAESSVFSETISLWSSRQTSKVFASSPCPDVDEAKHYVSICQRRGVRFMNETIMPQLLLKPNLTSFWIAFSQRLHANLSQFSSVDREGVNLLVEKCLDVLYNQLDESYKGRTINYDITYVVQLLELCIKISCWKFMKRVLEKISRPLDSATVKKADAFKDFYEPLLSKLQILLVKYEEDFTLEPFNVLARYLSKKYVKHVMGPPPENPMRKSRKLGCGLKCDACYALERFMSAGDARQKDFRFPKPKLTHLQTVLDRAKDSATYWNMGGTLQVTKHDYVFEWSKWERKKRNARRFFERIGCEDVIAVVLGEVYTDFNEMIDKVECRISS